jgi:TatA/E family protein of Tat protein translocase
MGPEWLVPLGIILILVIFGAKRLPEMARSVGRAQGEFKKGLKEGVVPDDETAPADPPKPPETDSGSGSGTGTGT